MNRRLKKILAVFAALVLVGLGLIGYVTAVTVLADSPIEQLPE
jgi:3-dehydroquinate dehydratase